MPIASKCLFLATVIYAAWTFTGVLIAPTSATVQVPEHLLSFLEGFVEGDFVVQKTVVKRSVRDVSTDTRVPQYMLDLYERLENRKLKLKFDIVRSFQCEGVSEIKELHSSRSKSSNFYKFIFNISHFPPSEYVLLAQLRIQAIQPLEEKMFGTTRLDIFSLLENPPALLSSRDFNPNTESLFTVDITPMFQKALYSHEKQLFLGLLIPKSLKDFLILDYFSTDGPQLLVMSKTVAPQRVHEDNIRTRMRRSLDELNAKPTSGNTSIRVVQLKNDRIKALRWSQDLAEKQSSYIVEDRISKRKFRRKKDLCRKKPLMVNFTAINYDWVIAPEIYNAYECSGRCSIPMSAPPTRHAIMQTLMHNLNPAQVSRACCVPNELGSISILYRAIDGLTVYLHYFQEMRVLECSCL